MPTPHKTRYFFSATIKVLKANSGMLLSCLVVPLLVLLAYGCLLYTSDAADE